MQREVSRQILFKVLSGTHEYVIYTDGSIEEFGDDAVIVNYFPQLQASLYVELSERRKGTCSEPVFSTSGVTSDRAGGEHSTPA